MLKKIMIPCIRNTSITVVNINFLVLVYLSYSRFHHNYGSHCTTGRAVSLCNPNLAALLDICSDALCILSSVHTV